MDSLRAETKPSPDPFHLKLDGILQAYLLTSALFTLAWIIAVIREAHGLGSFFGFSGSMLLGTLPFFIYVLFLLVAVYALKNRRANQVVVLIGKLIQLVRRLGPMIWVLFVLPITVYGFLNLTGWQLLVLRVPIDILLFGHLGLLGAIFLSGTGKVRPLEALLISFSIYGLALWVLYWAPDVQAYPLALGWSETTWFYDASLFVSRRIYGFRAPFSSLHPSRYLLQAVPFLIGNLPLWLHRLWQVLLWVVISLAGGIALSRRIKPVNRWLALGLVAWFTLFGFQGPVYYHLMVVIIIILLSFDKARLSRSLLFVVVASIWAGISRVNWFPMAGMLAATLYLLEKPQEDESFWAYWCWPVLSVLLGLAIAFGTQAVYIVISGRPPGDFVTSFQSPLLRYRLFPNEAFGDGIVILLLIAVLPVILVMLWNLLPNLKAWRPLRLLGLLSILVALLTTGLIVSMKIGGGNNLHNLDAFMVFLAIAAAYTFFKRFIPDVSQRMTPQKTPMMLIILLGLIPSLFLLDHMRPYGTWDREGAWDDIQQIQALIDQWAATEGEVLFIQDRHMLSFGMIEGVQLVPEYEKVFLMEMAMAGNQAYLQNFRLDLASHRFDLIVVETQNLGYKPASEPFSEENNAWFVHVAIPIDQYYRAIFDSPQSGISVMVPK
jgi:hypothetical protein